MKIGRYLLSIVMSVIVIALMSTGAIAQSNPPSTSGATSGTGTISAPFISFKNFPDRVFSVTEYTRAMQKGGHNLLIWRDSWADLSQYDSVKVTDFSGRLLPYQDVFSYDQFITVFNSAFRSSLKLSQTNAPNALLIEGAIVECNPGSRAMRAATLGWGGGRAAGAVVCEVFEPGKSQPCIRIYTRDTASFGGWGGNSIALLNNIFTEVAMRLAATLNTQLSTK